jgi:hypothetical protein
MPEQTVVGLVLPVGDQLNNREWASLFWLGVIAVFVLWKRETRQALGTVIRVATHWTIWLPFTGLLIWLAALIFLASLVGLWTVDLTKDTIVWTAAAVALYFGVTRTAHEPHYFRRAAFATVRLTVFVEFYVSLYVFSLPFELVLLPTIAVMLMLSTVAGMDPKTRVLRRPLNILTSLIGLAIIVYSTIQLVVTWNQVNWLETSRKFALPIWLTLAGLPFLYLLSLLVNYEQAFLRLRWAAQNPAALRRAKLTLFIGLHLRTYMVGSFGGPWLSRLTEASSFKEAIRVVKEYRSAKQATQGSEQTDPYADPYQDAE